MNQLQAFEDTLTLANERGMPDCEFETEGVDYWHIQDMLERIKSNKCAFSDAKLGRWLGWAQAVVVCGGYATLDEMKEINKRHKDSHTTIEIGLVEITSALFKAVLKYGTKGKWYRFTTDIKVEEDCETFLDNPSLSVITK